MPPTRRRRVAVTAPAAAWQRLGQLLELRRRTLGHTYRTTFERDSGINRRLAADIETAAKNRVNTFMPGTLQLIARGYQVTHESVMAVLRGDADELAPAPSPPAPEPPQDAWRPPVSDPARAASDRPWFDEINERRVALAARGITSPSGAQMFGEGTPDAATWDGIGARLPLPDRVWLIADLRRRAAGRQQGGEDRSGTG